VFTPFALSGLLIKNKTPMKPYPSLFWFKVSEGKKRWS